MHRDIPGPFPRTTLFLLTALCAAALGFAAPSLAAPGRIQGKIVATDTGEPIGYADLMLTPADTTMKKVGALSNGDGTFLIEAPAGRYTLVVRALSYATKRIENIVIEAGQLLPFSTTLAPEAIQQQEIVVEGTAKKNTEASMLAARRKAPTVNDAVSSEQMRRSPDKDAGEVLRRVTGLSVSDGKYVFVRGLGERYSSTEVDGVRIASPEQNKRVVPMDLFPAALLDNITVQKTYTADRAGEFGGGDVQVQTKDFPGRRLWSFSIAQGINTAVTFKDRLSYTSTNADRWGYGASARGIPDVVDEVAGGRPLTEGSSLGFPTATLVAMEKEFTNVWSPSATHTIPDGSYSATFGDQYRMFGHDLGFVQSLSFSRKFEGRDEFFRQPKSAVGQALVLQQDYQVRRDTESEQLGATTALNYRLARGHQLHLRGFYTNSADDEVRLYEGLDNYGDPLYRRAARLMYVQRDVLSGSLEGRHDLPQLLNATLDWRLTRSAARRQQPDRRESMYIRVPTDPADPNSGYWGLATGRREYGDLKDNAWGVNGSAVVPYRLGAWGGGKVTMGYDHQSKDRDNFYRRFDFIPGVYGSDAPPESVYDKVNEATLAQDNYNATQTTEALFLSTDVPLGKRLRANLGVRREFGSQDVISHDLFSPTVITSEGHLSNTDWLGGANVTWSALEHVNVRAAASRTLSRPDLDELSPRPTVDYVGSWQRIGNPLLQRAVIENYDVRVEAFPGLSEVLAAGVFLKDLHHPIETALKGASGGYVLVPQNSASGRNIGVELEARASLGRLHHSLQAFAINTNFSVISSEVHLDDVTKIGSQVHPLQGQAAHLLNAALTWQTARMDASVLVANVGRRLEMLNNANQGIPDEYDPGITTLDATLGMTLFRGGHLKLSGGNLLDQRTRLVSGDLETNAYRTGRTFSVAFSFGS